jgi:hypothetical protein
VPAWQFELDKFVLLGIFPAAVAIKELKKFNQSEAESLSYRPRTCPYPIAIVFK